MKISAMYSGKWCIKNSPNPTTQLKDWPISFENLSFLESRAAYLLQNPNAMPKQMLDGLCYKIGRMQEELKSKLYEFVSA